MIWATCYSNPMRSSFLFFPTFPLVIPGLSRTHLHANECKFVQHKLVSDTSGRNLFSDQEQTCTAISSVIARL